MGKIGLIAARRTLSKFLSSCGEAFLRPLEVLLQKLDPSVKSGHLTLSILKSFLLLLQPLVCIHQLLLGLVQVVLELLHLLMELPNLLLSPFCSEVSILGLLLAGVGPVHGVVLLELHGLHLLLDGVHCGALVGVESGKRSETPGWMT